jgi:hypothetical protein
VATEQIVANRRHAEVIFIVYSSLAPKALDHHQPGAMPQEVGPTESQR